METVSIQMGGAVVVTEYCGQNVLDMSHPHWADMWMVMMAAAVSCLAGVAVADYRCFVHVAVGRVEQPLGQP